MSKYLCGKCHRFYETQPEMKSCTHEDVKPVEETKNLSDDESKFNELIVNLDELNAEDLEFICDYLDLEYTNKENAVEDIKELLELEAE